VRRIYKRHTAGRTGVVVRSGLEKQVLEQIEAKGVSYQYEKVKIKYTVPEEVKSYTPDFVLPSGVIIETKGEFTSKDRKKTVLVLNENPDIDLRFVFSSPGSKLRKGSPTTYAAWCEKYGIPWAGRLIPESWFKEKRAVPNSLRRKK